MRIVLLGAPGAGKGTQSKLICENYKIPHISTGDIFRSNISNGTPLGIETKEYILKGKLVPDSITISLINERLNKEDCNDGFLLDGFPRNIFQAKELNLILTKEKHYINGVLFIDVSKQLILERVAGRRVCIKCGACYNIQFNPSKTEDRCQICGDILVQRQDDKEDVVLDRLSVYNRTIKPLLDYYSACGILSKVQGENDINDVFNKICSCLQAV